MIALRQQSVAQWSERSRFVTAEIVRKNKIQSGPCFRLMLVVPIWVIPTSAFFDLIDGEAKEKHVLLPCFLGHLDGRAVARPHGQRSIHHEFHVARSTSLVTCS